ncbi:hypothetical protein ABVT39_023638 [Epinephelus coioides]
MQQYVDLSRQHEAECNIYRCDEVKPHWHVNRQISSKGAGSEAVNWSEVKSPTLEDRTGYYVCLLSTKSIQEDGVLTADLGDLHHPLSGRGYGKPTRDQAKDVK